MTAYELYFRDDSGDPHLFGLLPERRTNPERITSESVINWARNLLGEETGVNEIYYATIKLKEDIDEVIHLIPISQS